MSEIEQTAQEADALATVSDRFAHLYPELRRLARAKLRSEGVLTLLGTTALVHESFLHLVAHHHLAAVERHSFMAYASRVMRSILVDYARSRKSLRRGEGAEHVQLEPELESTLPAPEVQVIYVHEALDVLAKAEPRLAQVTEMHFFGGMTDIEIASVLNVTERTVRRDREKARLLLHVALRE